MTAVVHLVMADEVAEIRLLETLQAMRQADDRLLVVGESAAKVIEILKLLATEDQADACYLLLDDPGESDAITDAEAASCSADTLVEWLAAGARLISWP